MTYSYCGNFCHNKSHLKDGHYNINAIHKDISQNITLNNSHRNLKHATEYCTTFGLNI